MDYTIILTADEAKTILNLLANAPMPWVQSNPLLQKLGTQMTEQDKPA